MAVVPVEYCGLRLQAQAERSRSKPNDRQLLFVARTHSLIGQPNSETLRVLFVRGPFSLRKLFLSWTS